MIAATAPRRDAPSSLLPLEPRSLTRCVELSGLSRGAVFTVEESAVTLREHVGFHDSAPLRDFFDHPEVLRSALARSGGRIVRLQNATPHVRLARTVLARAEVAFFVLVPRPSDSGPAEVAALGLPRVWNRGQLRRLDHTQRVRRYSQFLAALAGLPSRAAELIGLASGLHDVGKLAIPEAILSKPGPLDRAERGTIEHHAALGERILRGRPNTFADLAARIAGTHHERWDGSGYPYGLRAVQIPLEGRIAAVADVFDALTSDRPYRPALGPDDALELMSVGAGTHFDPHLVRLFIDALPRVMGKSSHDTATSPLVLAPVFA